jgi:hypothetical protein
MSAAAIAWHTRDVAGAALALGAYSGRDLIGTKVSVRLERSGEKCLTEKPPRAQWRLLADQFNSLLVLALGLLRGQPWMETLLTLGASSDPAGAGRSLGAGRLARQAPQHRGTGVSRSACSMSCASRSSESLLPVMGTLRRGAV